MQFKKVQAQVVTNRRMRTFARTTVKATKLNAVIGRFNLLLPVVVGERLIRFCHLVNIFALFNGIAAIVVGI